MAARTHFSLIAALVLGLTAWLPAAAESLLKPKSRLGAGADALLPVDEAFVLQGVRQQGGGLVLDWTIAPGYYLYNHMFKVTVEGAGKDPIALQLPPGEIMQDAEFGEVTVQRGVLAVPLKLLPAKKKARTLRVRYQGCADIGVCYPPQTRLVAVK